MCTPLWGSDDERDDDSDADDDQQQRRNWRSSDMLRRIGVIWSTPGV
jgi:hypothetical protein